MKLILNHEQMKNIRTANLLKPFAFLLILFSLVSIMNCGGKDDAEMTKGERILAAIEGTWTFSTSGIPSNAAALISNPSITITTTSSGATFTSDTSSGLDDFITGGSFSVSADGAITNAIVNVTSGANLSISGVTIAASESEVEITFSTSAQARQEGVGLWSIVINTN